MRTIYAWMIHYIFGCHYLYRRWGHSMEHTTLGRIKYDGDGNAYLNQDILGFAYLRDVPSEEIVPITFTSLPSQKKVA